MCLYYYYIKVEAALLTDPANSELLKLKQDLDEVIDLTRDLIKTQLEEQKKSSYVEPAAAPAPPSWPSGRGGGSDAAGASTSAAADDPDAYYDDIEAALLAAEKLVTGRAWKIGDQCQAKWTEDGVYYDATIEGITDGGEVSVVFDAYQNRSTTTLRELKDRVVRNEVFPSNKRHRPNNKEYLKKKKQKKVQRFKELEEERETDKNKWLNFKTKGAKKTGSIKIKSIFASPENVNGRVGIGTCGVSGKPMTDYSYGGKYRKGI